MREPKDNARKATSDQQQQQAAKEQRDLPLFASRKLRQQNESKDTAASGDDRSDESRDLSGQRIFMWKLFDNKAGMWTAIFTGFLVLFTYLLYRVADRQDETARANERAFLSLSGPLLGPRFNSPSGEWIGQEISLNWNNSGSTPAKDAVIQSNVEAWPTDLPTGFAFPETKDSRVNTVVGPKAMYGTLAHVSKTDLVAAWQNKSRLFFWGSVVYKDIFPGDPDRLTEFCIEMTHITVNGKDITDPNAALIGFQWQACRAHNCYDEDCKDFDGKVKELRSN